MWESTKKTEYIKPDEKLVEQLANIVEVNKRCLALLEKLAVPRIMCADSDIDPEQFHNKDPKGE